jgi:hypothetical protein
MTAFGLCRRADVPKTPPGELPLGAAGRGMRGGMDRGYGARMNGHSSLLRYGDDQERTRVHGERVAPERGAGS